MAREWQPGDVAMVNDSALGEPDRIAFCTTGGQTSVAKWRLSDDGHVWSSVSAARPLVVIDPEDREQVERLLVAQVGTSSGCPDVVMVSEPQVARMQAALRSLIEPPRPDEPTGLGAVVEDVEGTRWVRIAEVDYPWTRSVKESRLPNELFCWTEIKAVRVLSDGVTA